MLSDCGIEPYNSFWDIARELIRAVFEVPLTKDKFPRNELLSLLALAALHIVHVKGSRLVIRKPKR